MEHFNKEDFSGYLESVLELMEKQSPEPNFGGTDAQMVQKNNALLFEFLPPASTVQNLRMLSHMIATVIRLQCKKTTTQTTLRERDA